MEFYMQAFTPMDGFFLAVFLAVCILAAVLLRCVCYRFCVNSCSDKFRHNEEAILPRHATPTITPACPPRTQEHTPQMPSQSRGLPQIPSAGTVFTIYTFPQQQSPELQRSTRSFSGLPKYSSVPSDSPPKYEDLFPIASKSTTSSSASVFEMQVTTHGFSELHSIPEESLSQAPSASSVSSSSGVSSSPAGSSGASFSLNSDPSAVPNHVPTRVPKEDPPLYDTIYPRKLVNESP